MKQEMPKLPLPLEQLEFKHQTSKTKQNPAGYNYNYNYSVLISCIVVMRRNSAAIPFFEATLRRCVASQLANFCASSCSLLNNAL